ncbi:MAG: FHA domain-containing protein [Oligoflexia bacterium]|nr:FHA domain-containing protein [Oligoflexia bacterium]
MKLLVYKSGKLIKSHDVSQGTFDLGRSEESDICILAENVSRKHIEFTPEGNGLNFVKKSRFGVLTQSGVAVEEGVLLNNESLEIGDISIVFSVAPEDFEMSYAQGPAEAQPAEESQQEPVLPEPEDSDAFTIGFATGGGGEQEKSGEEASSVEQEEEDPDATIARAPDENASEEAQRQPQGMRTPEDATVAGVPSLVYQLNAISGPYRDKVFLLEHENIIAGRGSSSDIVLVDDMVSRTHARFTKKGFDYYLTDLKSANGVRVNGKKINQPTLLLSGDIIEIGSSTFRLVVINPQVQSVQGVDAEIIEAVSGGPAVEKIEDEPSPARIRKVEKSFGYVDDDEDEEKIKVPLMKKPAFKIAISGVLVLCLLYLFSPEKKPKPKPAPPKSESVAEEVAEPVEEARCLEEGLCHLPIGVQRQLLAEYEVGVKLFKNFQYELAEDRAHQILLKAPDWKKAQELYELAKRAKEELLLKKKKGEEDNLRKILEQQIAELLKKARLLMKQKRYEEVKEICAKILEIDPNNEEAKAMLALIAEIEARRLRAEELRRQILFMIQKYEALYARGMKYFNNQEYRKAIETFQKCVGVPSLGSERIKQISDDSRRMIVEANDLMLAAVTPELSIAEEMYSSEQYLQAIAAYKRVLKFDYKSTNAKQGIAKSKREIEANAKEIYARAAIAESVSDLKNACLLYNSVIETALPGTRYYKEAMNKVRMYCK